MMNLFDTDREFMEYFESFRTDEVVNEESVKLDERTRSLAILATLAGCQGIVEYKERLKEYLVNNVLTPVEVKELVYQAVDYLGIGRVKEFLIVTNEVMTECGIALPLKNQGVTTKEDRMEKGLAVQVEVFGEGMKDVYNKTHINRWLAANCFGDVYTRKGLSLKEREMITLCILSAQGGCEPQLTSHAAGNMSIGNDKDFLIAVVSQCVPYIGYPRTLNAVRCINDAAEARRK